jgi:uncharacterized cupredoxin-like copper-binding protein
MASVVEGEETMRLSLSGVMASIAVLALGLTGAAFAGVARHETTTAVTVTFTDTTFRLSSANLESGATTFVVVNRGKRRHLFAIQGPGVKGVHTTTLAPGGTAKLTVRLRAGAYVLSDPVGLGAYNVQFLDVVQAAVLTAKGGSDVVAPPVTVAPMCTGSSGTYTP